MYEEQDYYDQFKEWIITGLTSAIIPNNYIYCHFYYNGDDWVIEMYSYYDGDEYSGLISATTIGSGSGPRSVSDSQEIGIGGTFYFTDNDGPTAVDFYLYPMAVDNDNHAQIGAVTLDGVNNYFESIQPLFGRFWETGDGWEVDLFSDVSHETMVATTYANIGSSGWYWIQSLETGISGWIYINDIDGWIEDDDLVFRLASIAGGGDLPVFLGEHGTSVFKGDDTGDIQRNIDSVENVLSQVDKRGAWHPPTLADLYAENNSIYYSSDAASLVWKDKTGSVRTFSF